MTQTEQISIALKQCLKQRNLTYADLAKKISMSEASVKRLLSQNTMTLTRLEEICQALDLDFYTLARMARGTSEQLAELSLAQEKALAQDIKLLTLFHLLLHDWRFDDICATFEVTQAEGVKLLTTLDRLKLIELLPNNKVRLVAPQKFTWRSDGPVRQRFQATAIAEYLAGAFAPKNDLLRLEVREMSPASMAIVKRKMERLAVEFNELAEVDSTLAIANRESVGMVLAIRPWVFSIVSALKRKINSPAISRFPNRRMTALILTRICRLRSQLARGLPRPVRVIHDRAGDGDHIGLAR